MVRPMFLNRRFMLIAAIVMLYVLVAIWLFKSAAVQLVGTSETVTKLLNEAEGKQATSALLTMTLIFFWVWSEWCERYRAPLPQGNWLMKGMVR